MYNVVERPAKQGEITHIFAFICNLYRGTCSFAASFRPSVVRVGVWSGRYGVCVCQVVSAYNTRKKSGTAQAEDWTSDFDPPRKLCWFTDVIHLYECNASE